jgi:hypothetical protein
VKGRRTERYAVFATLVAAGLLTWWSTLPNWAEADERSVRIHELNRKVGALAQAQLALEAETSRLAAARSRQDSECRSVPQTADVAGLMQALALEVDGAVVRDQTFTVMDRPKPEADRFQVLPVQIEVDADFASVWSVIERAEGLPRLLRISGLEISMIDRKQLVPGASQPLHATVSLDVVYAPPGSEEVAP